MNRLEKILRPKSIVIIGASRKEGSLGKTFIDAILRMQFTGSIYPVNPKADEISGIKAYPHIHSLPEQPDLAVILLAYPFVAETMKALGRQGIKNVIVISAGFKEVGAEGVLREQTLLHIANENGMNLLGPNCMGVFNTEPNVSFNGTFSPALPKAGHVAYISQSGALGVAIMELLADTDLGFSVFVSAGNKADITDNDVLEFLAEDPNTKVITLYLESIDEPAGFKNIARHISAKKPILALKAGRTESGLKAASSHTGALANPEYMIDGFFKQCGIIRKNSLETLFDAARALAAQPLPSGKNTAIITNAGGPGILASDALEKTGLRLANFSEKTKRRLMDILPEEASANNPVDMIASANHQTYKEALEIVTADNEVDSILLIIVQPPVNTTPQKIAYEISSVVQASHKTIIPVLMVNKNKTTDMEAFHQLNLPVYSYPESAVEALGTMWKYRQIQNKFRKSEVLAAVPKTKNKLHYRSAKKNKQIPFAALCDLLEAYDIKAAKYIITENQEEILQFSSQYEKIVLKIANEEIIHKSDSGLVCLNLGTQLDVKKAFREIYDKAARILPDGADPLFLAQQQIPSGVELVIGGKRDKVFGPIMMVGFGGIFIEVLKDVSFRVAPLNLYEAKEMVNELRSQSLLDGFRGMAAIDRDKFAYTIQRFSLLFAEHPQIREMDLNPLIWSAQAGMLVAVDLRATAV
jgi:acetyltransferase